MGSVTMCIRDLETRERREEAVRKLWDRYFEGLVRHALKKLRAMHAARGIADQEDAAVRAFAKVCRGIEAGQLRIGDRGDFLKLLRWSTNNETKDLVNRYPRQNPHASMDPDGGGTNLDQVPGMEEGFELLLAEEGCRRLLALLGEEVLRRIALWKFLGHTNEEVARKLDCSLASVERKIGRIRAKWAAFAPADKPAKPGPRNASGMDVADGLDSITTILRWLAGRS